MDIKFSIGHYVLVINPNIRDLYYKVGRIDATRRDRDTMLYRIDFDDCMLHDREYFIQEKDLRLFKKFNTGDIVKITDNVGFLVDEIRNKIGTIIDFKVDYFGGFPDRIMYKVCLDGKKECFLLDSRYVDAVPTGINYSQMYRRDEMKTRDEKQTIYDCIDKVIFNGDRTIILWESGAKTMVKCADDEEFDYYSGFCAALTKKIFGSTTKAQKFLESKMVDQNRKEELSVDSLQDAVDSLQGAVDRFREDALKGFRRCIQMLYRQYDPDEVNAALNQYIQAHKKENEEPKNE